MKNRIFKLIFSLTLLSVLFMIIGCGSGGGGQKIAVQASPEEAVYKVFDSWRVSPENSPSIVVDSRGNFVRQATADDESTTTDGQQSGSDPKPLEGEKASGTIIIRKLYAPSDQPLVFNIYWKNVVDTKAYVYCKEANDTLYLTFILEFDENKWWIEDVIVTDESNQKPMFIVKYQDLDGNNISAAGEKAGIFTGEIGQVIKISDLIIKLEGYEYVKSSPEQTTVTIEKNGNNLEIILYYRKISSPNKGKYIIQRINKNSNEVITTSSEFEGNDGEPITVSSDYLTYKGYSFLENESVITNLKIKAGETIVIKLYFLALEETQKYTIKYLDSNETPIPDYPAVTREGIIGDIEVNKGDILDIPGYKYLADKSETKGKLEKDKELVFKLYYEKIINEYTISGLVKDSSGALLSGALIQVFNANNPNTLIATYETESNGSYTVKVPSEGKYLLVISGYGYTPQTITVNVPDTTSSSTRANIKL